MIEATDLSKQYGDVAALRGVSFKIERGDIFGFIGPNGAGKTTTIKILATLVKPTGGDARICGESIHGDTRKIRTAIGYMPDSFGVYEEMRVDEYLEFFAAAYGLPAARRRTVVADILKLVDLAGIADRLVGQLSRGTQQRLGLARVLVHDPQVLLLDEPASGLDPRARIEIRELIKELGRMGKTVLVSSHILSDLADICNKVGIIEKGRLVFTGTLAELAAKTRTRRVVLVAVEEGPDRAREALQACPAVESAEVVDGTLKATLRDDPAAAPAAVAEALVKAGLRLSLLQEEKSDLEDAFMQMTKGIVS
jgi:ABC-2 type transport system ATP-binding protein